MDFGLRVDGCWMFRLDCYTHSLPTMCVTGDTGAQSPFDRDACSIRRAQSRNVGNASNISRSMDLSLSLSLSSSAPDSATGRLCSCSS